MFQVFLFTEKTNKRFCRDFLITFKNQVLQTNYPKTLKQTHHNSYCNIDFLYSIYKYISRNINKHVKYYTCCVYL